jgi:hypothetical protein
MTSLFQSSTVPPPYYQPSEQEDQISQSVMASIFTRDSPPPYAEAGILQSSSRSLLPWLIFIIDPLVVQSPSNYVGPPCDINAELAHAETFLSNFISAKVIWNTKVIDPTNDEMCGWYLMKTIDQELGSMIAFLKDMEKGGWSDIDDEYMEIIAGSDAANCAAWLACRLTGDSIGEALVVARVRVFWHEWEKVVGSHEEAYQCWATVFLNRHSRTT